MGNPKIGTQLGLRSSSFAYCLLLLISVCPGVLAQQQSFRRRPEDVEVKLGDTAILRCEIENQAGAAQWTKDGFALGFKKEIPGFARRYSMVGEAERGVHNLRIVNVTLKDIAEYQCQVGPSNRIKAIRSDAHLNVLVPPKSIEMTNHAVDATISVKEKDQTELECVVKESRPAATIIWYRNDVIFRTESREDSTEEIEVLEDDVRIKKNTTRSKIKFLPSAEDDFSKFSCEARHPALLRPQKIGVSLRVQYPPGAPRIDGYNEGDPIRENQSVTLVCISRGGNPLAELIWFKNDVRVDSTYATQPRDSRNELTFIASTKDNLARFRCEATNMMSPTPKIADVVLTVMFPPKEVKITGPNEGKIGDTVTLNCLTSNSNPRADIAWFKGGSPLEDIHTSSTASVDGGFVTASNVTFKIEENDRKETFTCQAVNRGLGDTKSQSHVINVIQPPGQPVIYQESVNITVGRMQRITCSSTGGHPAAVMTWYRAGKKVDSDYSIEGNTAKAALSLEANMTDNGVPFKCEAKNKALTSPLSATITFSVLFPPNGVSIHVRPKKLKEGEKAYLTCESGSSNPPARVSFHKDLQLVSSHLNQTIKEGKHGGKKTSITMELDLTSGFDGVMYTCEAKNSAITRSVHDTITLDVNYKPKFVDGVGEKVSVVEGEPAVITVRAKGNPDTIKYKWMRNNSVVKAVSKKLILEGPILNFTEVSRKDKGKYECEGSNSEGSTTITVELDVKYPASILATSPSVLGGQGEDAQLECSIDANPLDESMVQWKYGKEEASVEIIRPVTRVFQDKKSYLTVTNVSVEDAGLYWCIVNNGIGQPANNSVFLIVKHKPKIDESPQIAKAASNKDETGKLICRAKGAPNVTFSWSREGVSITPTSHPSKYAIHNRSVDLMTWESILEVRSVHSDDYGFYKCIARNEMDYATHFVKLDITSAPDTPLGLQVVNFTHDSVTLTWVAGFDGGFNQSYRIQYIRVGSDKKQYVDVTPSSATTFTVSPLALGAEYSFSIMAFNDKGFSNYTTEKVIQETSSVGTNSITTGSDGDYPTNPFSRVVISVFIVVGTTMLLINVLLIACFIKRRTKKRLTSVYPLDREFQLSHVLNGRPDLPKIIIISVSVIGTLLLLINILIVSYFIHKKKSSPKTKQDEASEQGSSKSATIEMYAPSSYNETVTGETLSSISEKSASYSHGENHDEYIEDGGKGMGVSTYLVEPINHHSSGYPYREMGGGLRASTLPRHPKHLMVDPHGHHEDDGYVDALRRNAYNTGIGDKVPNYGRTTPRPASSRPPQVPPIPELYNIPPEARYVPYPPPGFGSPVGNGNIRHLPHSASHDMLNAPPPDMTSFQHHHHHHQPNGRILNNGPLSPQRGSILSTFAPNPSPNIEHEGHLV